MNDTVAIVGTHPRTRESVPYQNNKIDIWVFNSIVVQEWCKRTSVVFDMHKPETFGNYDANYGEWLVAPKTIPLYMLVHDDRFPGSIPFPYDEVVSDLLPNFVRGEKEEPIPYFTSSVCYALALAIHMGYKRIEFYGIEMESNTEYIYQRDGIALFMGIAAARGIKVFIPKDCSMFMAPRYGYDDNIHGLDWETLDGYSTTLIPMLEESQNKLKQSRGTMEAIQTELVEAQARGDTREQIMPMAKRYEDSVNDYEQCIANYANLHGQYMTFRNLQVRVGKQLEAAGGAQKLIAVREEMKPR